MESRYKRKLEKVEEELSKKMRRRSRSSETRNEEEREGGREGKEEEEDAVWKKATGNGRIFFAAFLSRIMNYSCYYYFRL